MSDDKYKVDTLHERISDRLFSMSSYPKGRAALAAFLSGHEMQNREEIMNVGAALATVAYYRAHKDQLHFPNGSDDGLMMKFDDMNKAIEARLGQVAIYRRDAHKEILGVKSAVLSILEAHNDLSEYASHGTVPKVRGIV